MSGPTQPLPPEESSGGGDDSGGDGSDGPSTPFSDRDVPIAVTSGVLLAVAFLGTLFWHPAAFSVLVAVLIAIGLVETSRVWRGVGIAVSVPVLLVSVLVTIVGAYRAGAAGQTVGVVTLVFGAALWELTDLGRREVVRRVGATILLGTWVGFLGSYAVLLARREPDAWVAVLATIGVAVVADIGAYVVGTRFGRRKLAPTVSPGKTWEGVLGGLTVAAVLAVFLLPLFGSAGIFDPISALVFALVVAAAGVVGDLTESMVKRDLGVKDLGGIIPGHGGVLDRVDAVLLALPTGYYALALLGK